MFREDPKGVNSKASESMNRRESKYEIFLCALLSECSDRNQKRPKKNAHVRGLLQ